MEERVFKKFKIRDDIVPNELTKLVALELDYNKDEYVYENKIDIILNPKELSNIRNSIIPTETTKIISLELSGQEQFCVMGFENEEELESLD